MIAADASPLIDEFHRLYYDRREQTWGETYWLGHHVLKCPLDLWIYQEILYELRPALIIETGTYLGGSAYFLASICDLLGQGEIVTVDIDHREGRPHHPRITYLTGSSTARGMVRQVEQRARGKAPVLVILDSGHGRDHVLAEMTAYGPLVTPGSYLIVEDTNINGHPVDARHGPGPAEAVDAFLSEHDAFTRDARREKLLLTFNPGGFLRMRGPEHGGTAPSRIFGQRLWRRLRARGRG